MHTENLSLQGIGLPPVNESFKSFSDTVTGETTAKPFDYFLNAYSNILKETGAYQIASDKIQLDYASGRTDDMLAVMLAQEKAYASLNFTVQITSKILEAYKEIMRISL